MIQDMQRCCKRVRKDVVLGIPLPFDLDSENYMAKWASVEHTWAINCALTAARLPICVFTVCPRSRGTSDSNKHFVTWDLGRLGTLGTSWISGVFGAN